MHDLTLETPEGHADHALLEDESGGPDLGQLWATLLQQQPWRHQQGICGWLPR